MNGGVSHGDSANLPRRLGSGDGRVALWLAVLIASCTLLLHPSELTTSDGIAMYEVAKSLIEDGDLAITRGVVWEGRNGLYSSPPLPIGAGLEFPKKRLHINRIEY